jgi:hypothetical protein
LVTGNNGYVALTSDDHVRAAVQRQVDGMLADHDNTARCSAFTSRH